MPTTTPEWTQSGRAGMRPLNRVYTSISSAGVDPAMTLALRRGVYTRALATPGSRRSNWAGAVSVRYSARLSLPTTTGAGAYVLHQCPPAPPRRLARNVNGCAPRPTPCSAVSTGTRLPFMSTKLNWTPKPYWAVASLWSQRSSAHNVGGHNVGGHKVGGHAVEPS